MRLSWVTPNTPLWVCGWRFPPGEGVHGQENPVQETGENKPEGFTANGVSCHTQPFLVGTNVSHTNRVLNTPTDQAGGDSPLLLLSDGQEGREPGDGVETRDMVAEANFGGLKRQTGEEKEGESFTLEVPQPPHCWLNHKNPHHRPAPSPLRWGDNIWGYQLGYPRSKSWLRP